MIYFFYFLIEDLSGKKLIEILMDKIKEEFCQNPPECYYKSFKGKGSKKKLNKKSDGKNGMLLNDLAPYLKGFNASLADMERASVVIVVDSDTEDVEQLRRELRTVGQLNAPNLDCVYAIAVQEIEAWLLGDKTAILNAYPNANSKKLNKYVGENEGEIGTWETLADVVYKGGCKALERLPYQEGTGTMKSEWAERIGREMNLDANSSPSFNRFIGELRRRLNS